MINKLSSFALLNKVRLFKGSKKTFTKISTSSFDVRNSFISRIMLHFIQCQKQHLCGRGLHECIFVSKQDSADGFTLQNVKYMISLHTDTICDAKHLNKQKVTVSFSMSKLIVYLSRKHGFLIVEIRQLTNCKPDRTKGCHLHR